MAFKKIDGRKLKIAAQVHENKRVAVNKDEPL